MTRNKAAIVSSNENNDQSSSDVPFVPLLSPLTDGASIKDLDPTSCIPLFLTRQRSDNAVYRLMSILNGDSSYSFSGIHLTGMVSGPPTSMVVPLIGELSYVVDEFLSKTIGCPTKEA